MKRCIEITILCSLILLIFSCFPEGDDHSLIDITLINQSSYDVNFFTRRVDNGEEMNYTNHGTVFSHTSESFGRSSGYTYSMYCRDVDNNITWGPQEEYIEYDRNFEWEITDLTPEPPETPEPTPDPTDVPTLGPTADIIINNNLAYDAEITISGEFKETLPAGNTGTYTEETGEHILHAYLPDIDKHGSRYIDLTETGYTWDIQTNTELYPEDNCRVWNFEDNAEDQLGIDDWTTKTNIIFTQLQQKFGAYSLKTDGQDGSLSLGPLTATEGESQSAGAWFYLTGTDLNYHPAGLEPIPIIRLSNGNSYITCMLEIDWGLKDIKAYIHIGRSPVKGVTVETTLYSNDSVILDTWNYIAFSYNKDNDTIYFVFNDTIYSTLLSGIWYPNSTPWYWRINLTDDSPLPIATIFVDEAILIPNQFVDPQVFVDHYNHDALWGEEYIP
jgi:hypothetical protein